MRTVSLLVVSAFLVGACHQKPEIQPTARYATVAGVLGGVVYIVGGVERIGGKDTTVATVEVYDPGSRRWTASAPMRTPRAFAAAAPLGGKLYVFGGLDPSGRTLETVEAYDPMSESWNACPPMTRGLSRLAAVQHLEHGITVAGGLDASNGNAVSARYFLPDYPATVTEGREGERKDLWRWWGDLPSGRHGLALMDAMDGSERMFAVGGFDGTGPLADVEVWGVGPSTTPGPDGKPYLGYAWRPGPPLSVARGFFGLATIGRNAYAVGGRCPAIPPTEVLDLDHVEAGWRKAAPLPKDLCRFSMVEWKGHLLAFGGETKFGMAVNTDVLEYDPSADAWSVR